MEQSNNLEILNDIRILISNKHQEQFLNWQVDISYDICLDMRALFSYSVILEQVIMHKIS